MAFELTHAEWKLLSSLPTNDLVQLAGELNILIPSYINRKSLLGRCVPLIVERGRKMGGLPLSKYDKDDVEALNREQLAALAALQGIRGRPTVAAVLRVGARVHKASQKASMGNDPVAYMVPILLGPIVRHAMELGLHR